MMLGFVLGIHLLLVLAVVYYSAQYLTDFRDESYLTIGKFLMPIIREYEDFPTTTPRGFLSHIDQNLVDKDQYISYEDGIFAIKQSDVPPPNPQLSSEGK